MRFKVDESFTIRHKILETLFNDQETSGVCDKRVGSIDICKQNKCPIDKVHRYHEILKKEDEIDCCEENGHHRMFIKEAGRYAYLEKKYEKQGWTELWDFWFQPLKVIIPFFALVVSAVAIILNLSQTSKLERLNNRIDQLEKDRITIDTTTTKSIGKGNTQILDTSKN